MKRPEKKEIFEDIKNVSMMITKSRLFGHLDYTNDEDKYDDLNKLIAKIVSFYRKGGY